MSQTEALSLKPSAKKAAYAPWGLRIVVAATAVLCYANAFNNGFCYDSVEIVRTNPMVIEAGHWLDLWTVDHWYRGEGETANRDLLYRPVSLLSYRVVYALAGGSAFAQHFVNIALHALLSLLVLEFARKLEGGGVVAGVAGLVFAVLPIHTEVVADVVGRAELLASLGVLAALLAHRKLLRAESTPQAFAWGALAALAAFCALGSKESGIGVVALVPLWDAYWSRIGDPSSPRAKWWTLRTVTRLAYLLAPTLVYLALRFHALGGVLHQKPAVSKTVNALIDAPTWQHALGVVQLWGMYWAKTFAPVTLCIDYSINAVRLATGVGEGHVLLGLLVTAALVIWSVVAWRRGDRRVALLAAAVLICYLPVANVFVLLQVFFAERIWYLPSVWVSLMLGMAVAPLVTRRAWKVVFCLALLAMLARCWIRNFEWKDNGTLFAAAHRDHPDGVGSLLLYGRWLGANGDYPAGVELIREALAIDPGYTDAHRALGHLYLSAGEFEPAVHHLQIAQMQFPGHQPTTEALALASAALSERASEELDRLRRAAADRTDDVQAELAYVRKLLDLGRNNDALSRFEAAGDRFDQELAWQREYAAALVISGRRNEAIDRYRKCLTMAPDDGPLLVELAALLMERRTEGDLSEVEGLLDRAGRLTPDHLGLHILRADLLALEGDLDGAVEAYRKVIRSLPPGSDLRRVLEDKVVTLGGE
jgi:tetratricopeptide (TPR) repeat protein